jgi:hypothetical protein
LGDPIKKWNEKLYALFLFEESILFFTYFTSNLKLRMNLYKVKVYNEGLAIGDNLADDCFIPMNPEKFNPAQKRIQIPDTVIIFLYLVLLKHYHNKAIVCFLAYIF